MNEVIIMIFYLFDNIYIQLLLTNELRTIDKFSGLKNLCY